MTQNGNGHNGRYTAQQFIDVIPGSGGIITTIAARVGCAWHTAKKYIVTYATIEQAYNNECERLLDAAESVIVGDIVEAKDVQTAKWYLTMKGDQAGYASKQKHEYSGPEGGPIEVTNVIRIVVYDDEEENGNGPDSVLPIKREKHLIAFVRHAFGVEIPWRVHPDCEGRHVSPRRAFCDAYFAEEPVTVWKASRGFGGKSFLLALLGLTEAVTLKADVNILGGSGEQSQRVHEYAQNFWYYKSAPSYLLASDPSKRETRLVWGNYIRALMASSKSARGPHPQRLRLDEIDEMALPILDAAMGQPMESDGISKQTVMSSTHHYPDKTMTEVLDRARSKSWPIYEWCFKETISPWGWLPVAEIESKKREVTKVMWETEYELQEPNPSSRAIDPTAIKRAFRKDLGVYEGSVNEYIEIEDPDADGEYATGADWAKEQDYTVIITLRTDVHPMRCVAFRRTRRKPWPAMVKDYDTQLTRFPGESCHDKTGLGGVVDDYISEGLGVILSGRRRQDILSDYISAIERGEIVFPYIRWMQKEHSLASVDAIYGTQHLPDSICAGALSNRAAGDAVEVGRV